MAKITTSLQETVRENESISQVFFDKKGNHAFTAFRLADKLENIDKNDTHKVYTKGEYAGKRKVDVPGTDESYNVSISIGRKGYEVVETLSREEILAALATPDGDSAIAQIMADPNAKAEFTKHLLSDPATLEALKSLISATTPVTAEPVKVQKATETK